MGAFLACFVNCIAILVEKSPCASSWFLNHNRRKVISGSFSNSAETAFLLRFLSGFLFFENTVHLKHRVFNIPLFSVVRLCSCYSLQNVFHMNYPPFIQTDIQIECGNPKLIPRASECLQPFLKNIRLLAVPERIGII